MFLGYWKVNGGKEILEVSSGTDETDIYEKKHTSKVFFSFLNS